MKNQVLCFVEDICFVLCSRGFLGGRLDGVVRPFSGSSMEMDLSMESLTLSMTMDFWMEMVLLLDFDLEIGSCFLDRWLGKARQETRFVIAFPAGAMGRRKTVI